MSADRPRLVLIGPPASGKTKIGRAIAKLLGETFVDTDHRIVERYGPIPDIFAHEGEPWFREKEREEVVRALSGPGVVSLGGGAIINEDTREDLAQLPVALFVISADAVAHRVTDSPKRPLLVGGVDAWSALVEARMPWYQECATQEFDVSHRPVDAVAAEVVSWLEGEERR